MNQTDTAERGKKKPSLERELYQSFLMISALIILLSLGITLYFDITRQRRDMDDVISGTAAYMSSMPGVISMLEEGYPNASIKQEVDSLSASIPGISVVVICDRNGLRFYHSDRQKTGETYVNGDETAVLNGSEPYITTGYGTKGAQRRAFHAVRNEEGTIIGFVMASVFTARISARHQNILVVHLLIFILMMLFSFSMTHTYIGYLKTFLMGFNPDELVDRYIRQDEVINSLDEGLIATDSEGQILFHNQAAASIFPTNGASVIGRPLRELFPSTEFETVIGRGRSPMRRSFELNGRNVLINEVPIHGKGKKGIIGVLVIILDKTETLRLSDELSGAHSMMDTLRAFNHEFLNKLHIILGYLQTGEIQRAIEFITNSSLVSSQSIRETANCIREPRICALVIGKMMHAAELGIRLTVNHDSSCMEQDLILPLDAYITIIGNLLENAIEELANSDLELQEIHLGLYCRPDCSIITCEDSGRGIEAELLKHIFEKGVSSKGENRGTGLYLIRQLTENYHGEVEIETEPGEGSCFTITFTRKEIL